MTTSATQYTKAHVAAVLDVVVQRWGDRKATRVLRDGDWQIMTYAEFGARVRNLAAAMVDAGLTRGDRVGLFAPNSPEWWLTDLAIQTAGGVPVPIYGTSTPEQIRHILADSGAGMLFLNDSSEADQLALVRDQLPGLTLVASFVELEGMPAIADLEASASEAGKAEVQARLDAASPDELNAIIYTSGTTGSPKGVMISQRAMIAQIDALSVFLHAGPEDHSLCFLPLSHALERGWSTWVLAQGCMTTYVANARTVAEMLQKARPTMMASVPKLYDTVMRTAQQKVAGSPTKQKIFDWALRVGGQNQRAYRKGKRPNLYWRAQLPLADKLVLSAIREGMGGPKNILACGGAPMRVEVEEFFSAAGMPILYGYGLTEASPLVSFNAPTAFKNGTVGRVMPGGELAIGQDSEILFRGPNLMDGYWNQPEATAEVLKDGWLHTGDAGHVDNDGFLVITDRIKDIIVTLGGKNIAPQPIEGLLLADPLFEQAVLIGNNRPALTLLVSPSLPHLSDLAERLQIQFEDVKELFEDQRIVAEIKERVHRITEKLPSQEQIRDLRIMSEQFTMDNGLLTPTLKVKRREAEHRFKELIDDMYERMAELRRGVQEHFDSGRVADHGQEQVSAPQRGETAQQ